MENNLDTIVRTPVQLRKQRRGIIAMVVTLALLAATFPLMPYAMQHGWDWDGKTKVGLAVTAACMVSLGLLIWSGWGIDEWERLHILRASISGLFGALVGVAVIHYFPLALNNPDNLNRAPGTYGFSPLLFPIPALFALGAFSIGRMWSRRSSMLEFLLRILVMIVVASLLFFIGNHIGMPPTENPM